MNNKHLLAALALALTTLSAAAHRPWLLPSSVMSDGRNPVVTVDGALAEDLFDFDAFSLKVDDLLVVAPDGSRVPTTGRSESRRRVSFDIALPQKGTYRVLGITDSAFATWKVGGEMKRWRGSIDAISQNVPADAQEVRITKTYGRVETFVSNDTTSAVAKPAVDTGLALQPMSSPTDLAVDDTTRFVLTLDGKPLPNANVTVIRGGNRYRYKMGEIALKTGADGSFAVTWPEAGRWWLGVNNGGRPQGPAGAAPAPNPGSSPDVVRRDTYSATFEVLLK